MEIKTIVTEDLWSDLKQFTPARISLGRAGGSLLTSEWLDFKLAHAKARDAVHCQFDCDILIDELQHLSDKVLLVSSQIKSRTEYLQRPDLGRRLDAKSIPVLKSENQATDLVFIITDGLSATAIHAHATNLLKELMPRLITSSWIISPLILARFGRVALEDEIGALMGAKIAVILIGERPGLSSPDSLGVYLVYKPRRGNLDADRNCVSNIRPAGFSYEKAADTIIFLLEQARQRKLSGIKLKDNRRLLVCDENKHPNDLQSLQK